MPVMPYAVEKGPICEAFEDELNDPKGRVELLERLRDPSFEVWTDPAMKAAAGKSATRLKEYEVHVRDHFLGAGGPSDADGQTGWLHGWQGDANAIAREALIRGIEVALGLAHDEDPEKATRAWTIQLMIICGAPLFQGWVTWRAASADLAAGQVSILFTTPTLVPAGGDDDDGYYPGVLRPKDAKGKATGYATDVGRQADVDHQRGIWAVGYESGDWYSEPGMHKPLGAIRTVRIALEDGGVRAK